MNHNVFRRHHHPERGASAVEMALVMPFLILILLGIIEFGYYFGQSNEIRHSAREAARFAAVSNGDLDRVGGDGIILAADVYDAVCDSINLNPNATVDITIEAVTFGADGDGDPGDTASISVTAAIGSLSNAPFISPFLPNTISTETVFQLEQAATWDTVLPATQTNACP